MVPGENNTLSHGVLRGGEAPGMPHRQVVAGPHSAALRPRPREGRPTVQHSQRHVNVLATPTAVPRPVMAAAPTGGSLDDVRMTPLDTFSALVYRVSIRIKWGHRWF